MVAFRRGINRIFLILLLLLSLLGCTPREEKIAVEYRVLFSLEHPFDEAFRMGAPLLDGVSKEICGTVSSVEALPFYVEGADGTVRDGQRTRLIVTVRAEGVRRGDEIRIGSFSPLPGKRLYLHAPCVTEGICLGGICVPKACV